MALAVLLCRRAASSSDCLNPWQISNDDKQAFPRRFGFQNPSLDSAGLSASLLVGLKSDKDFGKYYSAGWICVIGAAWIDQLFSFCVQCERRTSGTPLGEPAEVAR